MAANEMRFPRLPRSRLMRSFFTFLLVFIAFLLGFYFPYYYQRFQTSTESQGNVHKMRPMNRVNTIVKKKEPVGVIDKIKDALELKLLLPPLNEVTLPRACEDPRSNSCNGTCLRTEIHPDRRERISQIINPPQLQISSRYKRVLADMSKKVKGHYDIVIAAAATDNHFNESQALMKNLHQDVFPLLRNFTFVYYSLGLSPELKRRLIKNCKCQVIDFPLEEFPEFFQNFRCYTFKPMIWKAHIGQSNVFVWLDASIRFDKDPANFLKLISRARERGVQLNGPGGTDEVFRTAPTMYRFFGDEPCAYHGMGEVLSGVAFLAREYFVERLILEPLVACALDRRCMCPVNAPTYSSKMSDQMRYRWKSGNGSLVYGLTHRYDQSALNILLMKIYKERYQSVLFSRNEYLSIKNGDHAPNYFPTV